MTRTIRIDKDVAKRIKELALPAESPNNTIRRALGKSPRPHGNVGNKNASKKEK